MLKSVVASSLPIRKDYPFYWGNVTQVTGSSFFSQLGFCIPVHHRQFGYNLRMRFDSHRLQLWKLRQAALLQALLSVLSPLRTFESSSFSAFVNL